MQAGWCARQISWKRQWNGIIASQKQNRPHGANRGPAGETTNARGFTDRGNDDLGTLAVPPSEMVTVIGYTHPADQIENVRPNTTVFSSNHVKVA